MPEPRLNERSRKQWKRIEKTSRLESNTEAIIKSSCRQRFYVHLLKTLLSMLSSPAPIKADLISFFVGGALPPAWLSNIMLMICLFVQLLRFLVMLWLLLIADAMRTMVSYERILVEGSRGNRVWTSCHHSAFSFCESKLEEESIIVRPSNWYSTVHSKPYTRAIIIHRRTELLCFADFLLTRIAGARKIIEAGYDCIVITMTKKPDVLFTFWREL